MQPENDLKKLFETAQAADSRSVEKQEFTPERAARIVFWSFFFSQGNETLQREILKYVAKQHPAWKEEIMSDGMFKKIGDQATVMAEGFLSTKNVHSRQEVTRAQGIRNIVYDNAREFIGIVSEDRASNLPTEKLISTITQGVAQRDYNYLVDKAGRSVPIRPSVGNETIYTDPYASHLVYYAILGNKTALPEFDVMFAAVREHIKKANRDGKAGKSTDEDRLMLSRAAAVVTAYNVKHPDSEISEEEVWKE